MLRYKAMKAGTLNYYKYATFVSEKAELKRLIVYVLLHCLLPLMVKTKKIMRVYANFSRKGSVGNACNCRLNNL